MYKVYCTNGGIRSLIYDNHVPTLEIFNAKLELELNKTGSFEFTIYPKHIRYDELKKMKSIITIYQNEELIFKGRILDDESGFYNQKQVICEGVLTFLIDSVVRPYDYSTETRLSPKELLIKFIDSHNEQMKDDVEKQFIIGTVDVEDTDELVPMTSTEYKNTWDSIQSSLVEKLGGYLYIRYTESGNYIDYVKDFDTYSNQPITLGKNLLDITRNAKGENLATAIIPIGKVENSETNENLTFSFGDTPTLIQDDIYGLKDYIYSASKVEEYGFIYKAITFDNIGSLDDMQPKAIATLQNELNLLTTIELKAVDLSVINLNFNSFSLGRKVEVKSKYHLSNDENESKYLVNKLSIDLLNPQSNVLTLSTKYYSTDSTKSYTEQNKHTSTVINSLSKEITKMQDSNIDEDYVQNAIAQVTEQLESSITQSSEEITTNVSEDYYYKGEVDTMISSVNTQFIQTNDEFEFRFNEFNQSLEDVASGADAQFQEISKYIRFVDGNIILGEEGNQITLKIQNDRISFLESEVEVAYVSNRKLYILQGEFINSLQLGQFAFLPRSNGNLSFKKVK